jgi:protein O-mannosyl-transferase
MKDAGDKSGERLMILAGAIAIIAGCLAAYSPAIMNGGFIWDDDEYVTANPLLTAPDGLYRIWFSTDSPSQYFPLTYTALLVQCRLWGFNLAGYHTVNVVIHCINALLLWAILRRLGMPGAWLAGAIFALHPVNVESVAWITELKNVLMLLFSLLSILCWVKFVFDIQFGRKAVLLYAGALLFYSMALFSKATACTLPAALVLILWLKGSPINAKRWVQIVPYVIMALGIGILVMWWEKNHQGTGYVNFGLSPAEKIIIASKDLCFYLWKLFWPVDLTFSYPRWNIDAADIRQYIWLAGFTAVSLAAWFAKKLIGRGLPAAIIFFAAMLFPMLSFFPLYTFVYTFVADHYQYMACIGPIVLTAGMAATIYRRWGEAVKIIIITAAGVLLITLGTLTWRQCGIYKDAESLWADTLEKNPDSWLAHGQMGNLLFKEKRYDEAITHFDRQLELSSYLKKIHPMAYSDAYFTKGLIFSEKGEHGKAAQQFKFSLEIDEKSAIAHYLLADALIKQGKNEEAIEHLRRGLEIAKAKGANNLADTIRQRLETAEKREANTRPKTQDQKQ